ncbi:hypothetical protein [Actinomadura sp. KC345]|uniref:hypothetical protein n=1 Tax=Actinomadura sp. KC345 TaxID=2530371 RepID=UPI0014050B75|nr:hypothetical protein [Actinomadura sp. KC345]
MTRTDPTNPTHDETTPAAPVVPGDLFARHQTITGLRALADFLEANPGVPVNEYGHDLLISARAAADASAAALVDQTAALLGVDVADDLDRGGHYTATRTFGRISYRIVHIPDYRRREHLARDSYQHNIRLDTNQDTNQDGDQGSGRAA